MAFIVKGNNIVGGQIPGGSSTIAELDDVNIANPSTGQALIFNETTGKWENNGIIDEITHKLTTTTPGGSLMFNFVYNITTAEYGFTDVNGIFHSFSSGGGGASTLSELSDVSLSTPSNGQVLTYNQTTSKWENKDGGSGGSADRSYYSEEKLIGKWIDGTNAYERTYYYETDEASDIIPDSIVDGEIISLVGSFRSGSNPSKTLSHYESSNNYVRCKYVNSTGINVETSDTSGGVWTITIRYHRRPWRELTPEDIGFPVTDEIEVQKRISTDPDDFQTVEIDTSTYYIGSETITYFTATRTYDDYIVIDFVEDDYGWSTFHKDLSDRGPSASDEIEITQIIEGD